MKGANTKEGEDRKHKNRTLTATSAMSFKWQVLINTLLLSLPFKDMWPVHFA